MRRLLNSQKSQICIVVVLLVLAVADIVSAQIEPKKLAREVKVQLAYYYKRLFDVKAEADGTVSIKGNVKTLYDKFRIRQLQLMFVKRGLARCDNNLPRLQLIAQITAMKPNNPAHPRIVTDEGFEQRPAAIALIVDRLDQTDEADRIQASLNGLKKPEVAGVGFGGHNRYHLSAIVSHRGVARLEV